MSITIHITDVRKWCEKWRGEPFHAISLDPPYSYRFLQNKWDNDIALQKSTWQGFADHLLPCAWGAAYSSPQHYHRLAVAVEDAGFRIHPFILNWFNAQGFPKATKVQEHPSHYYGGQVLRNSLEPVLLFQKPGHPYQTVPANGAGALNIDAARQPIRTKKLQQKYDSTHGHSHTGMIFTDDRSEDRAPHPGGYWPTNVTLTCQPTCNLFGHDPNCVVVNLDAQGAPTEGYLQPTWEAEILEAHFPPLKYEPKATRYERDLFLEKRKSRTFKRVNPGGLENDPRWKPITVKNDHPTVKPIALSTWIASLLLPPDGFTRRLLNPFTGSGTEAIGARLAGWEIINGIEQSHRYTALARARQPNKSHGTTRRIQD